MLKINVTSQLQTAIDSINDLVNKQIPFATAKALTDTSKSVKKELPNKMQALFEGGIVPFTRIGVFNTPATKTNLIAVVGFKDKQAGYLIYQIQGGQRAPTRTALRIPAVAINSNAGRLYGLRLTPQGNLPANIIKTLVSLSKSQVKLQRKSLQRLRIARGVGATNGSSIFYGIPRSSPRFRTAGLYVRIPSQRRLVPLILFPKRSASYKRKFDLLRITQAIVYREFPKLFLAAYNNAVKTARK
ncbi:MAG: hypothetical protein V4525_11030 [Pseudomonadota bacterium]